MKQSWLYRYEAKGIQAYVLAESRLRQIKGGSALIEDIGDTLLEDALNSSQQQWSGQQPERVLVAAGAGTIRFFSEEQLKDFAAHWPMLVQSLAPGIQIIHAWVPDNANWYNALQKELQKDRQRLFVELPEAGPDVQRSPRSGLPAVILPESLEKFAIRQGQRWFDNRAVAQIHAGEQEHIDPLAHKLWSQTHGKRFLYDSDEIAEKSYLAVIHIDGNDLGRMFMNMSDQQATANEMAEVSKVLSEATLHAAREAFNTVEKQLSDADKSKGIPGRPVVIGGDDITAIIRADVAMPFVQTYLANFEAHSRNGLSTLRQKPNMARFALPSVLTACAGISFIQRSYPFHAALDLADELCAFCKNTTRNLPHPEGGQQTPSSLAFYRVTASISDSYDDLMKKGGELCASAVSSESSHFVLTAGPYLLAPHEGYATIDNLQQLRIAANRLPTGALRQAVQLMKTNLRETNDRLLRLQTVLYDQRKDHKDKDWIQFAQALRNMGCFSIDQIDPNSPPQISQNSGVPLWREHQDSRKKTTSLTSPNTNTQTVYTTPLLDALTWLRIQPVRKERS